MSVPGIRLTEARLRAPPGQFRVVRKQPKMIPANSPAFFLVGDFNERYSAIERWRNLSLERRRSAKEGLGYAVYDDQGRINDAVGAFISEQERKAPPGKFRVVCVDFARKVTIKLVCDLDDRDAAIEYAKTSDEGPYTGFQVHDDTGAALIPID